MRTWMLALAGVLLLAGPNVARGGGPPTLQQLLRQPGEDVALIPGTSDYAPGPIRVTFLVVGSDGKTVDRPRARVWVGTSMRARPFEETTATLEPVGVPGASHGDDGDITHLYVAHLRVQRAGKYWIVVEPIGGKPIQGYRDLVVAKRAAAPGVGERATPSRTPTLATTGGNAKLLTTRTPPDTELLRYSVAGSIAAHVPFVLVFATPKYCTSRTCGPVVDVVDRVREQLGGSGVRFIHVEIYEGNNPANGPNRWVREWRLPSEPFTFLVGRDGRIKARFEGSVSVSELAAAVRSQLLRP